MQRITTWRTDKSWLHAIEPAGGSNLEGGNRSFLDALTLFGDLDSTLLSLAGTAYTMGSHAATEDRRQACCHPPCSH